METFLGFGFSKDEFLIMVKRQPSCLTISAETFKRKTEFVVKKMNWPLKALFRTLRYLDTAWRRELYQGVTLSKLSCSKDYSEVNYLQCRLCWWRLQRNLKKVKQLVSCSYSMHLLEQHQMSFKSRGGGSGDYYFAPRHVISRNWTLLLCLASFSLGMFFTNRISRVPEARGIPRISELRKTQLNLISVDDDKVNATNSIGNLDKAISSLETKLVAAKSERESVSGKYNISKETSKRKYFMVIGINTAFSSRMRRDSVRATWMPQGENLKKLEEEKGIIIRFVIGHSTSLGGALDKSIEAEEKIHGDFLRLEHVEGYMKLSAKTKTFFATAVSLWNAEFYIKVDDDVHVNLATLGMTLKEHRNKPRVYAGCMKSGPVLAVEGVKYHEPEYWKFGEVGNNYFRHATGQLYVISRDLATYILMNQNLLHKYANEDVSLGSWFIGLDVEHVDDRTLCCGTLDCRWMKVTGHVCAASFDWQCSGICRPVERMFEVDRLCGESRDALWDYNFLKPNKEIKE